MNDAQQQIQQSIDILQQILQNDKQNQINNDKFNQYKEKINKNLEILLQQSEESSDQTINSIQSFRTIDIQVKLPEKQYQKISSKTKTKLENYIKGIQNKTQIQKDQMNQEIINSYCKQYKLKNENITPDYQNTKDGNTIAMWLAYNDINIPQKWEHDTKIQNSKGYTVAMILANNKQDIPEYWQHDPKIQTNNDWTVALIYANQGRTPPKEWYHNKLLRCESMFGYSTVQNLLQKKNIKVSDEWKYTPLNEYEDTQAMIQAKNGQIPDKQYYHNPTLRNKTGDTVAMILAEHGIIPPKEWYHDLNIQRYYKYTIPMILAQRGIIPPKEWQNDPKIQNLGHWTVAMYIAENCKQIPPKEWYHDPNIRNSQGYTVAQYLRWNDIQVPPEWQD